MCEMQLKWFEHVKRTSIRTPMKRTDGMEQVCSKGFKGRQKICKTLRHDLEYNGLTNDMA